MKYPAVPAIDQRLRFIRHGATALNLAGLRCGGDLDVPLTDAGRAQVQQAVPALARLQPVPDLIITSDLQRTQETAHLIAQGLGGLRIVVEPGLAERRLGQWNRRSVARTQEALLAGQTPPGGESEAEFLARIHAALLRIRPLLGRQPLLVGSKGVARMLGQLTGVPGRLALDNAALVEFDLATLADAVAPPPSAPQPPQQPPGAPPTPAADAGQAQLGAVW